MCLLPTEAARVRPDRWDALGVALTFAGMTVIALASRGG